MRTINEETITSGHTGKEITLPKFGDKLSMGTIISYTHLDDGSEGWRPNGVALCYIGGNHGAYVVWNAICPDDQDSKWFAEHGNYCQTITQAVEHYTRRGGQ